MELEKCSVHILCVCVHVCVCVCVCVREREIWYFEILYVIEHQKHIANYFSETFCIAIDL